MWGKRLRLAAVLCVAAGSVSSAAPAASGLLVDAGQTQRVDAGLPFFLEARLEGASPAARVAWRAPAGCSVDAPRTVSTAATCRQPGLHDFAVSARDRGRTASDTVTIVTVHEFSTTTSMTSISGLGLPDEPIGSGTLDGATRRMPFDVPGEAVRAEITLDWTGAGDLDLALERPDGSPELVANSLTARPEHATVEPIEPGTWTAVVQPKVAFGSVWTVQADVDVVEGDAPIPTLSLQAALAAPGDTVTLTAEPAGGTEPYSIAWETTPGSIAFDDGAGESFSFLFAEPTTVTAKLTDALGLEIVATAPVRTPELLPDRPLTVVGVVDGGFTPYHYDFLGSQHPWNRDADPDNDVDFSVDPATYIEGYPGSEPLEVTLPVAPDEVVEGRQDALDAAVWSRFGTSSLAGGVRMYRFPGTKIIGAVSFQGAWYGGNSSHGTRSAASAAGNIHGSCPECLFVLINGATGDALAWAASQPWIDVVTNSYGHCLSLCVVRDGIYLSAPTAATLAGTLAGNTIVFSAGNGLANAFDVPTLTYTSSEKGPDWIVTVGANASSSNQNYLGAGKPVDISSIGDSYPSTGGSTATGTGSHSGTSNAAPVTAGTIAKVLQEARELLGDVTAGHADGVVAAGEPVGCGAAVPGCALGDGVLTRAELQALVYGNVLPAPQALGIQVIPTTQYAYYYQGHGALLGRLQEDEAWEAEWSQMVANARGEVAAYARPAGERNWFTIDSKCRQRFWGAWPGGYYTGDEPALDPQQDPLASAFDAWCSQVPEGAFGPR